MSGFILSVDCSCEELKHKIDESLGAAVHGGSSWITGRREDGKLILMRQSSKPISNVMVSVLTAQIATESGRCQMTCRFSKTFFAYAFAAIWLMVWMTPAVILFLTKQPFAFVIGLAFALVSLIFPGLSLIHRRKTREEYRLYLEAMLS
jgi:hypothetical protein